MWDGGGGDLRRRGVAFEGSGADAPSPVGRYRVTGLKRGIKRGGPEATEAPAGTFVAEWVAKGGSALAGVEKNIEVAAPVRTAYKPVDPVRGVPAVHGRLEEVLQVDAGRLH